jgi:HEAT repeat protein
MSIGAVILVIWLLVWIIRQATQSEKGGGVSVLPTMSGPLPLKSSVISNDFKRLNAKQAGLGEKVAAYVLKGEGATVLSTLSVMRPSAELDVCSAWHQDKSPTFSRRRLFAHMHPYDFDVVQRYAEALTATCAAAPDGAVGTATAPLAVRVFLSEAFLGTPENTNTWPRKATKIDGKGLTVETAMEMVRRLGGTATDLVDAIYVKASGWQAVDGSLYREAVDLRPFFEREPAAVVAAAKRAPAAARADILNDLARWDLGFAPAYLEFVVGQAGESAKAAREAAAVALVKAPVDVLEPAAVKVLQTGDVNQRAGMVDVLGRIGSPSAAEALKAHRETEKTARIVSAIDTILSASGRKTAADDTPDDARGYTAIDGSRIEVPPLRPMASAPFPEATEADRTALKAAIKKQNENIRAQNEHAQKNNYTWRHPEVGEGLADRAISLATGQSKVSGNARGNEVSQFLTWGPGAPWMRGWMGKLADRQALDLSSQIMGSARWLMAGYAHGPTAERTYEFLNGPGGDVRHLEAIDVDHATSIDLGDWRKRITRQTQKGDFLREALQDGYYHVGSTWDQMPRQAVWPYLAENLDVFDEAFGLKPPGGAPLDRTKAIRMLKLLPATPARYFAALLETATGSARAGRAEAREMLAKAPDVEQRLLALLDDSRQAIRAGAAEWLADRKDPSCVAALKARLKKEKSEVAQAAILTALGRLGEDLSGLIGPKVLIAEAEKGLKSAKFDKLAWLGLDNLPKLKFKDGTPVPAEVLRWWVALAFRLKQPGGNGLFEIYLDQLAPNDAATFSTLILDSWVSYDTARPNDADANAHAKAGAQQRFQYTQRWDKDYTEERAFSDLKREFMSQYLNSGADTKGLLALARRAPSATAAERTRSYLKNHGSRTSQASALLEMLAGIADPVSLQVVISAATRLKQKGVQKFAGELVNRVAEAHDWTFDELADRTIPSAGFDDDGILSLPVGEDGKEYEGRLTKDLDIVLRNPAGKEVSSLPSGQDEATTASKKQVSASKKELKQIISMQTARLYEALCAERTWVSENWVRFFHQHPVMRRLIERVIWAGLNADGAITGTFRATAEGDFTDAKDEPVDPSKFASIRLAHGALFDEETSKAWVQHMKDYEIKPLFAQFGRSLLRIKKDSARETEITDRKGWLTDAFTIRGAASKLGYERGPPLDGGYFNEYRKSFQSAGMDAVIEFTGNSLPEQNVPASIICLKFERRSQQPGRAGGAVKLGDVPPVLLSECWNDYYAMADKGVYDAEWEKKSPW